MPLKISVIQADITTLKVDAIVNAANSTLLGGRGVDGAIHKAAGPGLLAKCKTLNGCQPGSAVITHGYNLPARYVIHTVGPVWKGGHFHEAETLEACYQNSLILADAYGLKSVAFPCISAGDYGYPPRALPARIAIRAVKSAIFEGEVIFCCLLSADVSEYINELLG